MIKHFDDVAITTTTQTGYMQAKKFTQNARYLPFDLLLPLWMKKQKVLVVLEAELWYLLFAVAKKKGVKTVLLSARISDRSYKSYKKFRWFYKKIFANIDKVYAQSQKDKQRLLELGAKDVVVSGNIKLANLPTVTKQYTKPKRVVITAASTHENEERLIFESFVKAKIDAKLIIVPRHPQRFDLVDSYLKRVHGDYSYAKLSQSGNFDADITLVDSLGELNNIYSITDVTLLAGSFEKIGGHNPIEPAYFENVIISGSHYFNQQESYRYVENIVVTQDLVGALQQCQSYKKARLSAQKFDLDEVIKGIKDASV